MTKQEQAFLKKVTGKVGKALKQFNMTHEGDKILIGVSGGKDSLITLETLAKAARISPVKFKLYAVHINATNLPYEIDRPYIETLCNDLNVEFIVKDIFVDFDSKAKELKEKNNCFICSWNRRKTIFSIAEELGCNKIALGHHMDDAAQTLLMNMAFQGSICSIPAKLDMFNGKIQIIRPLILTPEKDLVKYAKIRNFTLEKELCPYEDESRRKDVRNIIKQLNDMYPHAVNNIYNSMSNIMEDYLPMKV